MGAALMLGRRQLLAGAGGLVLAGRAGALPPPPLPPSPVVPTRERLQVGARATDAWLWQPLPPAVPRGVALLSTGHGSWPERYGVLAQALVDHGLAVVAPLHVDSVRHPDRAAFTREASFGARIADLRAAAALAATRWPDRPLLAAGHSFGTLSALCLAGALPYLGDFRLPGVTAVLGFSSPGRIPGLVRPDAYAAVAAPLLLVTGTADTVPGFVTDPADHLFPVETAKGPAFGLVLAGAGHELVGTPSDAWQAARQVVDRFLSAYLDANPRERAKLIGYRARPGDRFIARNAA